jgi:hypothetical protein
MCYAGVCPRASFFTVETRELQDVSWYSDLPEPIFRGKSFAPFLVYNSGARQAGLQGETNATDVVGFQC